MFKTNNKNIVVNLKQISRICSGVCMVNFEEVNGNCQLLNVKRTTIIIFCCSLLRLMSVDGRIDCTHSFLDWISRGSDL